MGRAQGLSLGGLQIGSWCPRLPADKLKEVTQTARKRKKTGKLANLRKAETIASKVSEPISPLQLSQTIGSRQEPARVSPLAVEVSLLDGLLVHEIVEAVCEAILCTYRGIGDIR